MEKSIETIWKEGFLASDALVAPKLNDLYNQKSKHIVDKLKRMMKINIYAIIVFAFAVLVGYYFLGVPYLGAFISLLLIAVVVMSKKQWRKMEKIDNSVSSYEYLISFNNWLKGNISDNIRIMRYFYPLIFIASMAAAWFMSDNEATMQKILMHYPNIHTISGMPTIPLIGVVLIAGLMALFGGRIYKWDVNLVYGRVFRKLEEIITDMDELRS